MKKKTLRNFKKDSKSYLPCTKYRPPPPSVVFSGELEVGQGHGDTCCHTEQYTKHDKQYTVQGVLFPAPQSGKNVIQLHRYSTENKAHKILNLVNCFIFRKYNNKMLFWWFVSHRAKQDVIQVTEKCYIVIFHLLHTFFHKYNRMKRCLCSKFC